MKAALSALFVLLLGASAPVPVPPIAFVTIVMLENREFAGVAGNPDAPYFNGVLRSQGVLLTNAHAVAHPSQPNYLALFSGSTHDVRGNRCPVELTGENLATQLAAAGKTFAAYAEALPSQGFRGCWNGAYARKHAPWADFASVLPANQRTYRTMPLGAATVTWIVPDLCHDMHDCSTRTGDDWLARNLPPLLRWNASHDGLLIVTFDEAEPDRDGTNRIPALLAGPMVRAGATSPQRVDLYGLLATIERATGLPCLDRACGATPVTNVWRR